MMEWPSGQERRAWLNRQGQSALDSLQYYLGPGVPVDNLATIADAFNPVADIGRAGVSARGVVRPGATIAERVGSFGDMATDIASVAAPAAGAGYADDAARVLEDAILGMSFGAREFGRHAGMVANQPGTLDQVNMGIGPVARSQSPAETQAQEILDLLASGRASEVTDDMMAAADPQYLYRNYDIPMDVRSRMQRAEDMGFDMMNDFYHGTARDGFNDTTDIIAVDPAKAGDRWGADDRGFAITNAVQDANYYARPGEFARQGDLSDGAVYPLMDRSQRLLDIRVGPLDGTISAWDERPANTYARMDAGGYEGARLRSDGVEMRVITEPQNLRSRFARFDPRLSHLRNLSAGVGGLAALPILEQEIRAYLDSLPES